MSPDMKALADLLGAARRAGWDHGRCYAPDHEWRRGDERVSVEHLYGPGGNGYWWLTIRHRRCRPQTVLSARVRALSDIPLLLDYAAINPAATEAVFAAVREGAHR